MPEDHWTRIAPVAPGGTVLDLTLDREGRFWAATWGGLFRQGEHGWTPSPSSPPIPTISGIWAAGPYLFAAGIGGGLARSLDGGQTWDLCWLDEVQEPIICLAPSPSFEQDGVLLAGTDGAGVLRSEDWGRRWQRSNVGLQDLTVTAVACAPHWDRREVAFAATLGGLYRSSGGGRAWRPTGWVDDQATIETLAVAAWTEEPGYLLFVGTQERGLFQSANAARTFQPVGESLPAKESQAFIDALWVDPDLAETGLVVVADGQDILRSEDAGKTWEHAARDVPPILCLAGDGTRLAAGLHLEGLLASPDGGRTWEKDASLVCRGLARLTAGGGRLFAFGAMEGAWWSPDGRDWQPLAGIEDEALPITTLEAAQGPAGLITLAGTAAGLLAWRGNAGPEPISQANLAPGGLVTALAFSPDFATDGHVWAGQEDGSLWQSTDAGRTWTPMGHPFGQGTAVALAPSPDFAADGLLVAVTHRLDHRETIIWRSLDRGDTWEEWTRLGTTWPRVTLVVAGEKGIHSWASLGTLVMQPAFRGWTGQAVSDPPPIVMRVVQSPDGQVVAATAEGVYRSPNGRTWKPWNDGLDQGAGLLDLVLFAPEGEELALWGLAPGGVIWRLPLQSSQA